MGEVSRREIERRDAAIRDALAREGVDALIVSGSEYTGFDGAVLYTSGFQIVHRYAYVLVPREGEPAIVFPSEARYVGRSRAIGSASVRATGGGGGSGSTGWTSS